MWFKHTDKAWMDDTLNDLDDAAYRLWSVMNTRVAHDSAEGRVTGQMLRSIKRLIGQSEPTEDALVAAGLWHDEKSVRRCSSCKDIPPKLADGRLKPGEFYVHDWLVDQFTRDESLLPEVRRKALRKKRLNNSDELREQIYERDKGLCRYCGIRVNFKDKVSDRGGERDHVDPDGGNELSNVVTACKGCNREKGNRTPAEWVLAGGRPLLGPGQVPANPGPAEGQQKVNSGGPSHVRAREVGPGQVEAQPRPTTGQPVGNGSGNGQGGKHG